ncbi:metal ABC transporter ATP-binding protein [Blochmannia endosymbiont of Polyrhachis (Hedomyrma) turneri]|uniref:metal ABC transporter ATP-binding protein n=1 Tax=Blochmannia endosymbiont of Polyrhachis (Hedomyrma) turneri TaxID=1505596 RepID=UPI00061A853E|nr:ATP-binding cassette domain-containing protein [Blochmannia endosymbiont of Polyrhachis (Hedomyrma) turneri]AKC59634.1 ABC transporter protein [Blochmannia endosymbiont of Polyrhachis (Hedomyrma) turneri]
MIKLNNLSIGYSGRSIKLPSITGQFKRGSMTAILGTNGIGKSTFLKTLAGFLPPAGGELKFNTCKMPRISYLPQRIRVNYRFPLSVFDVVAMGCWPVTGLLKKIDEQQNSVILESLRCVKLDRILQKDISVLSAGQFQCMLFARLLVQQSSLILLDEPFNSIDCQTCDLMLSVIDQLHYRGSTIIIVLHNSNIVTEYFSDTLLLSNSVHVWEHI